MIEVVAKNNFILFKILKKFCIYFSLILSIMFILFYLFNENEQELKISLFKINSTSQGLYASMINPILKALDSEKKAFNIKAKEAVKIDSNSVMLYEISGNFITSNNEPINVMARNGMYDIKTKILKLEGEVELKMSNGYIGKTQEMSIDMDKKMIFSKNKFALSNGVNTIYTNHIKADSNKLLLENKVHSKFQIQTN